MYADASGIFVGGGGGGGNFAKFSQTGQSAVEGGTDGNVQGITELGGTVYVGGHYENYCGPGGGQHVCTDAHAAQQAARGLDLDRRAPVVGPERQQRAGRVRDWPATGATVGVGGDFTSTGQRTQPHFAMYQ